MRMLTVSALFPPEAHGGAENSAWNMADWLRRQGHEQHVLATAQTRAEAYEDREERGLRVTRVYMPRPYPVFRFPEADAWQKPLWHVQDHLDPRNRSIVAAQVDRVRPDVVLIHYLQGFGYNALDVFAERGIPVVYFLHDLGLACVRMSMYAKGKNCETPCGMCRLSAQYKAKLVARLPRVGFASPSRANLDKLARFFPVRDYPHAAILNVNAYPMPTVPVAEEATGHFVFVGRLHQTKGVHVLLEAASRVAARRHMRVTIIGSGPAEAELRAQYGAAAWCRFTGALSQTEIANIMAQSDALCVPSIWWENSPGVAIHALATGTPVLGSDMGGIPELVQQDYNGALVPPGDVEAWAAALDDALSNPQKIQRWKETARAERARFAQDCAGKETLAFIERVRIGGGA